MKYLKTFEGFKNLNSSSDEILNEEFVGKLLGNIYKSLKKKASLKFSKMFGSAGKINKVIEEYKKERTLIETNKISAVKALGEYLRDVKAGGEKDDNKKKELENNLKKQENLFNQQLELKKKKYDLKFRDIMKDEKNEDIKFYVELKKIELEEEFLSQELKLIQSELGLTDDVIKQNPVFQEHYASLVKRGQEAEANKQKQESELQAQSENKGGNVGKFNFEEAKTNKDYLWTDSQFSNGTYKFGIGEEIKIFISESGDNTISTLKKDGDNYKGTDAFVFAKTEKDRTDLGANYPKKLRVGYVKGKEDKTFLIDKGKVITTKKLEEEKQPEAQEKK